MKPNSLAVLILNYNGKHFLKNCYNSLKKQTESSFDIWLVDNNSSDGSRVYTKQLYPDIQVINTEKNAAYAGAYNHAHQFLSSIGHQYQYYLLLNNDTIVQEKVIEDILNTFLQYENAGIVVPTIVDEKGSNDAVGGTFLFPSGTTLGHKHGQAHTPSNKVYQCFWASGAALAVRTDLVNRIGLFHDYFIYYEDVDLSWRINNAGYEVLAFESSAVLHIQGGANTPSSKQLYLSERNRIYTYWQNLSLPLFALVLPVLLCARIILLLYKTSNWKLAAAKLKGIIAALTSLHLYPKIKSPLINQIKTIARMSSAIEKETI